jgi:NAD(P)-dependent dehydrogenase (short-subunit alcohol dehydrogenase family)
MASSDAKSSNTKRAPFTEDDVAASLKVLEAIAVDRGALVHVDRETRLRLLEAAGRVSLPDRAAQRKLAKAFRRKERAEDRVGDESLLDATGIRTLRRAPVFETPGPAPKLEARAPHALSAPPTSEAPPSGAPSPSPSSAPPPGASAGPELRSPRKCYVCKAEFTRLHPFYDQLCPSCADLNYKKRTQTADLRGRVALITGARVKIGYQAAILLLRAGARVIVTTRFPHDAAARYARERDFEAWADRLEVHGLDLRLTPSVERFAKSLNERCERLDFIIHNACQTVRRPPGFYSHLIEAERLPLRALPEAWRPLVADYHRDRGVHRTFTDDPALLSQVPVTPEDLALSGRVDLFPSGELDADLQQIDLRPQNSWRLTLAEVPTVELLEVHLVNAVAPFVLSSKLKPLMVRHKTFDKHIVNVSAMEGQFYRDHKTDKHPHTNMAKAALNMLTRTSAQDYAKDGIYMNSVDTGWVTDEDPAHLAAQKREVHGFHPPLDIVDGAARICDPIFNGLLTGEHAFGLFYKDYLPTDW